MEYQTITLSTKEDLAVIILNRPDVMNAMNAQMRAEVKHAVIDAGRSARAIVITGAGRAFCTGQDLGDAAHGLSADLERTLRDEYGPMVRAIAECPVPVIAAVNGPAAGAGANLALACDVVIASEKAYFMQAFTRIGLIPDAGGTYALPRQVGMAKAMGAALFADKISATDAEAMGMIWEVVPEGDFADHWAARARFLADGPTQAFGAVKRVIRESFANDLDTQLEREARAQGACGNTRDFDEGVMAFLEKRAARFEGR